MQLIVPELLLQEPVRGNIRELFQGINLAELVLDRKFIIRIDVGHKTPGGCLGRKSHWLFGALRLPLEELLQTGVGMCPQPGT